MSVVGFCVVLGLFVLLLLRTAKLSLGPALVCVLFGLVLATTPAGPAVHAALDSSGAWVWAQVASL